MSLSIRLLFIITCIFITADRAGSTEQDHFREDFSSKWFSVFVWGMPTFSYYNFRGDPAMASNIRGINHLRLGSSKNKIYPSGFINTQNYFSFGSYSARIKVSDMPGAVASFFACSEISNKFTDGTHDEIDFEFLTAMPHSVLMTTWSHATGTEGAKQTHTHNSFEWKDPSFDIRQWHVYRFDWHPDKVDFYIDGIKRWTSTKAVPGRKLQIALHLYTHSEWKEVQFPPKGEVLQMTDWVEYREFKPLPQ